MAVNYVAAVKTARMEAVLAQIGAGAKIVIGTAGLAQTLVTFTLPSPSGTVAGDTLTFDMDPDLEETATAVGTAAEAKITTSADVDKITGLTVSTVAAGTGDIQLDTTSIAAIGQAVKLITGTLQHAA